MTARFNRHDPKYGKNFRLIARSKEESESITQRIRLRLLKNGEKVFYTVHALEQRADRRIDHKDVIHVLLTGHHFETREYEDRVGRFRENFDGQNVDGDKNIRVVIREEREILIITVIEK